jgi:hypothetical protein
MLRLILLGALALAGCSERNKSAADAPAAPVQPPGFRAPTLQCSLQVPSGWTTSGSPMPDHILEVVATAPKLRGRLVAEEATQPTVAEAAADRKQRTVASWGNQPDFTLLREVPQGEGLLLAYQWRPQASAPIERHLIAILPLESKVVVVSVDDDGATPESSVLATIGTLACTSR